MADTLAANISESTQEIIQSTLLMMPTFSPCMNLVTRHDIPKGKNSDEIPAVATIASVANRTSGEEITQTSQFDLTSVTITPVERTILVRIESKAERYSQENLVALVTRWLAQTQARNVEQDIVSQFQNFNASNDLGGNTTDLVLTLLRTAMRLLKSVTQVNGGPAPQPISTVIGEIPAEDLLNDLGVQGVVSSTSPWIPAGMSEELIRNFGLVAAAERLQLVGSMVYTSSELTADLYGAASSGIAGGMFSKEALYYAVSQDWTLKVFEESEWPGPILRVMADFDTGVGPYDSWGSFLLMDGP